MRKTLIAATAICAILAFNACKKSDNVASAHTVQNISGSYLYASQTYSSGSITINVFDSLQACERDNEVQLHADLSYEFKDVGTICDQPEDSEGNWSLSAAGDSIYIDSEPGFIKSWDGKTLVVTSVIETGPPTIIATTTLVKK